MTSCAARPAGVRAGADALLRGRRRALYRARGARGPGDRSAAPPAAASGGPTFSFTTQRDEMMNFCDELFDEFFDELFYELFYELFGKRQPTLAESLQNFLEYFSAKFNDFLQ